MVLGRIFKRVSTEEPEDEEKYIEVPIEEKMMEKRILVRIDNVKDNSDVPRIQKYLREGNIVFLKIKEVKERDLSELKRIVDKLRKTCAAMNGDIVGVDEDFLVITPSTAKIYRGIVEEEV